jgi:crossover junction endodeoxyribonuclease RuvC
MADERILGIDPGSRNTGYAVLTRENGTLVAKRCDVIKIAHLDDHADRLQYIFEKVSELVRSFEPASCAIETPVYGVDPLAMLKLGRAQAAAMLAITDNNVAVTEYYPKKVKKSITGNGNASKKQVAFMLRKMVTLPDEKLSEDATDALAVAWCHLMKQNAIGQQATGSTKKSHQNAKSSSWSDFVKNNPDRIKD